MSLRRGTFALAVRRCLAVATLPTLLAAVAAVVLHAALQPAFGPTAAALAAPWLLAPLAVAAGASALAAVLFWPGFATRRPGQDWIDARQRGRSGGVAPVLAGALLAQAILVLPLTLALGPLLGAPAEALPHVALTAAGGEVLTPSSPRLRLPVATAAPLQGLWLRPLVGMPVGDWVGSSLVVRLDGDAAAPPTMPIADARRVVYVPLPGRPARELTIEHVAGTVPLAFPPGAATAVVAAPHGTSGNLAQLAGLALVASFTALSVAALCGLGAGLPTVLAVAATTLFLQFAGGIGPLADAALTVLRGQWLDPGTVFVACAPSLGLGAVAMIVVMLLRPRIRR